jgi:hypothetical protein
MCSVLASYCAWQVARCRLARSRAACCRAASCWAAHLTMVFAALAISRRIENTSGWATHKFVRAPRCRAIQIQAGPHAITAAHALTDELQQVLTKIHNANRAAH